MIAFIVESKERAKNCVIESFGGEFILCFSDGLLLLLAGETKTKRKEIAAVCL
jgi:hypothetical protein